MKALTINGTNYGPFHSIEVLDDRYRCDNTDLPFVVVGQGEIVDADTITWPIIQPLRNIQLEIETLEATITPRRRDEAILRLDDGWLLNIRTQIAELRKHLGAK